MRFFLITLSVISAAWPQAAEHANTRYKTAEGRAAVAKTLGAHDRDSRQRPDTLVQKMGVKPGMAVADIGTGVGYMLPYLSKAVGPSGKIYAEDIFPDFLDKARETAAKNGLTNVEFIHGNEKDAKLPANSADLVFILDAYHHFDYPAEMLSGIRSALKAGGRLVIVEFYKEGFSGDPAHIRFTEAELGKEVSGYGFELISSEEFNPKSQYMATFRKK
jgi:ubiquinone/menaquinone biosynthesis C-methylase UbiE